MTIDPELKVATTATEIAVAGDVTNLVNADNATVGATLERQRIEELPLNGRVIDGLIAISTPGVEATRLRVDVARRRNGPGRLRGAGQPRTRLHHHPSLPAYSREEFRVETNNYSAKMNRPATIIVLTRSGGNQFQRPSRPPATMISGWRAAARITEKPRILDPTAFGFWTGGPFICPSSTTAATRPSSFSTTNRSGSTPPPPPPPPCRAQCGAAISAASSTAPATPPFTTPGPPTRVGAQAEPHPHRPHEPGGQVPLRHHPAARSTDVNPMVRDNFFAPGRTTAVTKRPA